MQLIMHTGDQGGEGFRKTCHTAYTKCSNPGISTDTHVLVLCDHFCRQYLITQMFLENTKEAVAWAKQMQFLDSTHPALARTA